MSQQPVVNGHNCFQVVLPELPRGYRFDVERPMQLVPFNAFHGHLPNIDICRRCYIYALTNFDVVQVNAMSARATVVDPAAIALAGLDAFAGTVNGIHHPMYDDIYPVVPREGRTLAYIERHFARRGTHNREPSLQYLIKYSNANDPKLYRWTTATEHEMKHYHHATTAITNYWYGETPHRVNIPFIRVVLTALTPFANSAVWGKLPYEEASALVELWKMKRLDRWRAGLTLTALRAREDLA